MEYTEKEMKTIEQAKSNLLRGNDIESATLILEKVILDGMIIKCGRINILKVAARQIINFIEEYKNKEYLDVVREKVYANEESRRKDELIKKQQKEIEEQNKEINEKDKLLKFSRNYINKLEQDLFENANNYVVSKEAIREKIEKLKDKEQEFTDDQGYWGDSSIQHKIEILEELLGE